MGRLSKKGEKKKEIGIVECNGTLVECQVRRYTMLSYLIYEAISIVLIINSNICNEKRESHASLGTSILCQLRTCVNCSKVNFYCNEREKRGICEKRFCVPVIINILRFIYIILIIFYTVSICSNKYYLIFNRFTRFR